MIQAREGWAIIEFEKQRDHEATASGILVPSQRNQRVRLKGKTHTIGADPEHQLPDTIRVGTIVSSKNIKTGATVFYNKNDGFAFTFDEQNLLAIREDMVIAAALPVDNAPTT